MQARMENREKKQAGIGRTLLKFLAVSYSMTGLLLLILALLLYKFMLPDSICSAGVIFIYILTNFLTGFLAGKTMQEKKYLWGLTLSGLYILVLVVVSFLLKRDVRSVFVNLPLTLFLCLGSGMLGGMVG